MSDRQRWNLVSARDLVAFHATRRDVYSIIAELLADPSAADTSEGLWAHLRHAQSRSPGFRAIEALQTMLAPRGAPVDTRDLTTPAPWLVCAQPAHDARTAALALAGIDPTADRVGELRAMATLADETSQTIAEGDLARASSLTDTQARYLREHAAHCLADLARQLTRSEVRVFANLGEALDCFLADELDYLGVSGC